jgi:hypothetical protein
MSRSRTVRVVKMFTTLGPAFLMIGAKLVLNLASRSTGVSSTAIFGGGRSSLP